MGARLALYLFGTPGQDRFWFMWDDLSYGALGAVVLAEPAARRRLSAVNYFERRRLPFIVAVNVFDGSPPYDPRTSASRWTWIQRSHDALRARHRSSVKQVLITLVEHVLAAEAGEVQQAH